MSMLQHICLGTIGPDDFFQGDIGLMDVDTDLSLAAAFGAATSKQLRVFVPNTLTFDHLTLHAASIYLVGS